MTRLIFAVLLMTIPPATVARELPPLLVDGFAEFGPEVSRSKACDRALSNAKQRALRQQYGEEIGQKSVLTCDENLQKQTGNDCELFENTWSLLNANGYIKDIRLPEGGPKITEQSGYSVCKVTAYITIEEYDGQPDFSFETTVKVVQGINLRLSDKPIVEIESNKPAFHYVYYWAPFVDADNYYQLFPNAYDAQQEKRKQLRIPTGQATKNYSFEVSLPDGVPYSHEYLIVVSSKKPLTTPPEKIKEVNFFRWLKSFDRKQWTQSTFNYRVLGDSAWQT
jgi:hypothetical protein